MSKEWLKQLQWFSQLIQFEIAENLIFCWRKTCFFLTEGKWVTRGENNRGSSKKITCFEGDLAASYCSKLCHKHNLKSMRRAQQFSAHLPPLYRSFNGYRTDKLPTKTGSSLQYGWTASRQQNWPNIGGSRSFSLSSRKSSCGLTSSPACSSLKY